MVERGGLRFLLRSTWSRMLRALGASRLLILGFAGIIAVGTLMLRLPGASASGVAMTWQDALFTSTSATTVTGLSVVNAATELSFLGQVIVLVLLQVGGVGFIAFSVLLFRLIGRRVTMQERFVAREALGSGNWGPVSRLALYILGLTLSLESVGAMLLFLRWRGSMTPRQAAWQAVFHSVSAYCNAGFDLLSGTSAGAFFGYGADGWTLAVTGTLIVLGGLGVPVLVDVWQRRRGGFLSLHSRLTLAMAAALTALGAVILWADPGLAPAAGLAAEDPARYSVGLYTVVSARTAGLTVLDLEQLSAGSRLMIAVWMFIGGSPASMAGGISTSTVAVMLVAVGATIRGAPQAAAFGRALPDESVRKALAIGAASIIFVVVCTLLLVEIDGGAVFPVGFEAVSAFSNTGFSLGGTARAGPAGRLLLAFMMFWGRLGPLTIMVALAQREKPQWVRYPEEAVIMG